MLGRNSKRNCCYEWVNGIRTRHPVSSRAHEWPIALAHGLEVEQLADPWDDLRAVQLDVGHELLVGKSGHAVLQVEAGRRPECAGSSAIFCATVSGDADVERAVRPDLGGERLLGRDREAAFLG